MNNTLNLVISFVFIFAFCLFLRIELKHTLIIILISSIVIFIFQNIHDINIHYNNRVNNITNEEIDNYLVTNTNKVAQNKMANEVANEVANKVAQNKIANKVANNINGYNGKKYKKSNDTEIIPKKYYNQEDCTTDMSCIIKPDENNLGIKPKNIGIKPENIGIKPKNIGIKPENIGIKPKNIGIKPENIGIKPDNNLVVETFVNKLTPMELNDVNNEFNNDTILSYEKKNNFYNGHIKNYDDTNVYDELGLIENSCKNDDLGDLCFHCKLGSCKGGICKDVNELNNKNIKYITNMIINNNIKRAHPFSTNFPTIKITNPESRF